MATAAGDGKDGTERRVGLATATFGAARLHHYPRAQWPPGASPKRAFAARAAKSHLLLANPQTGLPYPTDTLCASPLQFSPPET
eukprot:4990906-Pyramimonas_sp.AAC.1